MIVIVIGSGNSGAGAVHDYLLSREDFISPFNGKEFRFVNDPDGLDDLYNKLYNNFSVNGAAKQFECFEKFIQNFYNSIYNKKNKIIDKKFLDISKEFLIEIIDTCYNGSPQFYFDKLTLIKKLNFYIQRFFFKKKARKIDLLKMIIPCDKNEFLKYSENYLKNIFKLNDNFSDKKNIVIENGGNFSTPISSTKYYGENRKIVVVSRNPKAIFWSMKRRNSLSYPGHDIKVFINWYKKIMKMKNYDQHKGIINIKFEKFFDNFEEEKKLLSQKLGIKLKVNSTFNLDYTLKNLYKYKDNLSQQEMNFIDENLNEYY
jgi:hypothetical protein